MEGKTLKKPVKLTEIRQRLDDHDEQLAFLRENMLSRVEFHEFKQEFEDFKKNVLTREEYLHGQDQVMTALKNIQQELSFMYTWLRRHDEEIKQLQTARL